MLSGIEVGVSLSIQRLVREVNQTLLLKQIRCKYIVLTICRFVAVGRAAPHTLPQELGYAIHYATLF